MVPTVTAAKTALILTFLILLFGVIILNAITMMISPRAWFRLPEWIRVSGSLTPRRAKYSHGWGALQVRLAGLVFLAFVFWMLFMMLWGHS